MIAFINSIVAGAGVSLLASNLLVRDQTVFAVLLGVATALVVMAAFLAFQRWSYRISAAMLPALNAAQETEEILAAEPRERAAKKAKPQAKP